MGLCAPLARAVSRTSFGRRSLEERADLAIFRKPPSFRLVVGVSLIGLSMIMGWPSVGVFGLVAIYVRDPLIFLIGGPATYAVSWVVWGAGMWIAGPDNIRYAKVLLGWLTQNWIKKACPEMTPNAISDLGNVNTTPSSDN
jgi:hypothetical protein